MLCIGWSPLNDLLTLHFGPQVLTHQLQKLYECTVFWSHPICFIALNSVLMFLCLFIPTTSSQLFSSCTAWLAGSRLVLFNTAQISVQFKDVIKQTHVQSGGRLCYIKATLGQF